jgi:hypothetical protein
MHFVNVISYRGIFFVCDGKVCCLIMNTQLHRWYLLQYHCKKIIIS